MISGKILISFYVEMRVERRLWPQRMANLQMSQAFVLLRVALGP